MHDLIYTFSKLYEELPELTAFEVSFMTVFVIGILVFFLPMKKKINRYFQKNQSNNGLNDLTYEEYCQYMSDLNEVLESNKIESIEEYTI